METIVLENLDGWQFKEVLVPFNFGPIFYVAKRTRPNVAPWELTDGLAPAMIERMAFKRTYECVPTEDFTKLATIYREEKS